MPEWTKTQFDQFYRRRAEQWGHPHTRSPITLNYHWASIIRFQTSDYAPLLAQVLGLLPGDGVILVGCGFNGTGQGLLNLGYRVFGAEVSDYILLEKGNTEEAEVRAACVAVGVNPDTDTIIGPDYVTPVNPLDVLLEGGRAAPAARGKGDILDEDLRVRGSRNRVLSAFQAKYPGVTPRYVVTEEVLNSIPDNEAALVASYCDAARLEWGSTVVHMLSPLQPGGSQNSALNWKTYAGWRSFLNTNGFATHLILPTVSAKQQGMHFPTQALAQAYWIAQGLTTEEAAQKAIDHVTNQIVIAYQGLF